MGNEAFIVDGIRSPVGSLGGQLASIRTDDLIAKVISGLVSKLPREVLECIEDVIIGCANQAGEDNRNVARMAVLLSGLPYSIPGETVNRLCASGLSAVGLAASRIKSGEGSLYIAGGVEGMTRAPFILTKSAKAFGRDTQLFDTSFGWRLINPLMAKEYGVEAMGETAENLATEFKISREDQDLYAFNSQKRYQDALQRGFFSGELMTLEIEDKGNKILIEQDEFPKPSTNLDKLRSLKSAFRSQGSVTAGNSSGLNDGACALLLASTHGLDLVDRQPMARIISTAVCGVEPRIMGIGPVTASKKALLRAGLTLDDMDVIEINEAFAAQVLSCTRALNLLDDDPRINPNGGAIAIGHPLGMSGSRLVLTCARNLAKSNQRYGLITMCVGVGQGYAMVIERC